MTTPTESNSASFWGLLVSTKASYAEQEASLKKEVEEKQKTLHHLREIQIQLSLYTGKINGATQETQSLLIQTPIRDSIPNQLSPTQCRDVEQQLQEVLMVAELARKGEVRQRVREKIKRMNQECGKIRAKTMELEEAVSDLESVTLKMKQLIEERKNTIKAAQKISNEIGLPNESK